MRHFRIAVLALGLLAGQGLLARASADGCYWCHKGSSCDQCPYGSSDTQDARKACEAKGCKIGGTQACSSAANIKSCRAPAPPVVIAWCAPR